jgi:cyclin B
MNSVLSKNGVNWENSKAATLLKQPGQSKEVTRKLRRNRYRRRTVNKHVKLNHSIGNTYETGSILETMLVREREIKIDPFWYASSQIIDVSMWLTLAEYLLDQYRYMYKLYLVDNPDNLGSVALMFSIILQYLTKTPNIKRSQLQLVGIAAYWMACKMEEMTVPSVRDLVAITDQAYFKTEIIDMETKIATELNYDLTEPNVYLFTMYFLNEMPDKVDIHTKRQCAYASVFAMMFPTMYLYPPSMVAQSIVRILTDADPPSNPSASDPVLFEKCMSVVKKLDDELNFKTLLTTKKTKPTEELLLKIDGKIKDI